MTTGRGVAEGPIVNHDLGSGGKLKQDGSIMGPEDEPREVR
jgi:hypothetical protein